MMHDYLIAFIVYFLMYTIIVLSLNLAYGFTGLVNLGHMGFFGIGAYASALLTLSGMPWYFAMPVAALMASIAGTIIAMIAVRLKGDYFQIVTLSLVFMAIAVSRNWISLTRGALGLPGIPPIIKDSFYFMLFVLAVTVLCVLFFYWLTKSETGRIFQAIRDDEVAASVLGKNTYFYKVMSISISTFVAGIAGTIFAHYIQFVDPSVFDLELFVLILSMLIVGGIASVEGSVAGAFIFSLLSTLMHFTFSGISPGLIGPLRQMLFMAITIVILIYRPRGLFGKVDV